MQSCVICGKHASVVHPLEPQQRCGRCGELLPDAAILQSGPPPAPRRLPPLLHYQSLGSLGSAALFLAFMLLFTPAVFLANLVALVFGQVSPGAAIAQMLSVCFGAGILLLLLRWLWRSANKATGLASQGASTLGVVLEVDYGDADTSGVITYAYRIEGRPIPLEARVNQGRLDLNTIRVGQLVHVIYAVDTPTSSLLFLNGGYHT